MGDHFIEDWVDEEAEDQSREQPGDDDDGEGFLRVAAHAGGHGGGKKAQASHQRGHHDGAQAKERSFPRGFADAFALQAKFVDVAHQNDRGFDGDAQQGEKPKGAGDAERRVRELEGDQSADGFGENHAESDGDGEFEVAVEREKNHERSATTASGPMT